MKGQVTRLDGVVLYDPVFDRPIEPGENRHTELDRAPSEEALRYDLTISTKRRIQVIRNTGQLEDLPKGPFFRRNFNQEMDDLYKDLKRLDDEFTALRSYRRRIKRP